MSTVAPNIFKFNKSLIKNLLPEEVHDKVFVAGSCATHLAQQSKEIVVEDDTKSSYILPASDIDLYLYDKYDYDYVKDQLIKKFKIRRPEKEIYVTILADTFTTTYNDENYTIQLIKPRKDKYLQTYGQPENVITKFDFSIVRSAYLIHEDKFVFADKEELIEDLQKKRLRIKYIICPVSIVVRIIKYTKKGYNIGVAEIFKMFLEWDNRPVTYKNELTSLILRLAIENDSLTNEEFEKLEALLRVD